MINDDNYDWETEFLVLFNFNESEFRFTKLIIDSVIEKLFTIFNVATWKS